jgi:hypothetical protein
MVTEINQSRKDTLMFPLYVVPTEVKLTETGRMVVAKGWDNMSYCLMNII